MIGGLVLAAGSGERFGGAKQLAEFQGRPLLEHVVEEAAQAPLDSVAVTLGARASKIMEAVDLVICGEWQKGPGASLKTGLATLGAAEAIVVLLGDQPLVGAAAIERVLAARDEGTLAARATYRGELDIPCYSSTTCSPGFGISEITSGPEHFSPRWTCERSRATTSRFQ